MRGSAYIMIRVIIVAPTIHVGHVHVSFVSNPWPRITLTEDTYSESKIFIFVNRIEFDSIWWKHTNLAPMGKPRFFSPIGIIHRSAVTAMQLPSTS